MRVLERLNVVPVATCQMSDDGRVLVVDRFDVDERGIPRYGLEDACGLLGLPPHEKYRPTVEQVWNATRSYIGADQLRLQREHLGWHLLTNYVVRNADCHAKNIALYYTSQTDVGFTPVYDLVTTQAYPRFAASPPGLSIGGRQTWTPGRSLETFFKSVLSIPPARYAAMVEQLCQSAVEVGQEVIEASKTNPPGAMSPSTWRTPGMQEWRHYAAPRPHPSFAVWITPSQKLASQGRANQSLEAK